MARANATPIAVLPAALARPVRRITRNARVTIVVSIVLICGSFAAAAVIQMRNDRAHALAEAASFDAKRAQEIALDLSSALDRYAAVGAAFANTATSAETAAALSEAGGAALRNIAVLDIRGDLQSELTGSPTAFLPLSPDTLAQARDSRAIALSRDGRSFAIVFGAGPHIVAVELDARALMPSAGDEEALLATLSGDVVASGSTWHEWPSVEALALGGRQDGVRRVVLSDGPRLIALSRVANWPLAAVASSRVGEALDAWYGALPLYALLILGPGIAGAALAVVLVREFERRARASEAMRNLLSTRPEDARLLVRLADAERRVAEAERTQRAFMSHISHELRTPLNAIIGFSEVIEHGVFGRHKKYAEYAHDIGNAGRDLHHKIGNILEFVELEAETEPLARAPVDMVPLLREVIDNHAADARSRSIRFKIAFPTEAMALVDVNAAARILSNLLDNALRYAPSGSTVRVAVKYDCEYVIASLKDEGFGFTSAELAALGQPFRSFPRPGTATGAGMGLAMAFALARRMRASVHFVSAPGEGTLAELRLAKASVEAMPDLRLRSA